MNAGTEYNDNKDMCKNINTTLFNGDDGGEVGKETEGENTPGSSSSSVPSASTMVQLTDVKSASTKEICFQIKRIKI